MSPQVGCNDTPQRCEGDWSQAECGSPCVDSLLIMGAPRSPARRPTLTASSDPISHLFHPAPALIGWKAIT